MVTTIENLWQLLESCNHFWKVAEIFQKLATIYWKLATIYQKLATIYCRFETFFRNFRNFGFCTVTLPSILTAFFHLRCFHVDDDVYLEMLKRKFTKSNFLLRFFFGESLARFFTVLALDSLMTARKMIALGFQVCQEAGQDTIKVYPLPDSYKH